MLWIWCIGQVVKNVFRFGTLWILRRKRDKSHSASCTSHSLRASITMRMVDLDVCSQCWRGWMIKSQNWSWSCFPLASRLPLELCLHGGWSLYCIPTIEMWWCQRRASLTCGHLHSLRIRSWCQANCGYVLLVQLSSWLLISWYQLNYPAHIFDILSFHTMDIYLLKQQFMCHQSKWDMLGWCKSSTWHLQP